MREDFNDPHKLGFLRLFQVLFAVNVILTIFLLSFLVKGNYVLGFGEMLHFLNLVFDATAFWLICRRMHAARTFIIAFSVFNIVVGTVYNVATGSFDILTQLVLCNRDIILLAYFLTSRRVRAMLIMPLFREVESPSGDVSYYRPRTWAFWRDLIIYFCVFSVIGHWMEAGYCTLIRFGILPGIYDPNSQIWHDWLYPFIVYGFGVVVCILLLYPIKTFLQKRLRRIIPSLLISFIVNALVCTLIEFIMGMMLNQPLADGTMPLWDYRDMFCNFMGQVCLQNAMAFGLIATLMTWLIYPSLEKALGRVPRDIMNIAFVAVVVGFCVLFFLYCINILVPGIGHSQGL